MLIEQIKDGERIVSETYKLGNTTVIITAPPPMTDEELQKRLDNMYKVAWEIAEDLYRKGIEV